MATAITTLADLQNMQDDLSEDYTLSNNIDASGTVGWNILVDQGAWAATTEYVVNDFVTNAGNDYYCKTAHTSGASFSSAYWVETSLSPGDWLGFDPIGLSWDTDPFDGSFDGGEYTISGLYINRPDISYVGLFAATYPTGGATDGLIKNIKLTSVDITGDYLVGGLVGDAYSEIKNCSTTGTVAGKAGGGGVGGLAGYAYTNVYKCWSSCTVTSTTTDYYIGGLLGKAGFSSGETIELCYATGNVTASNADWVGGLVGDGGGGTISNCYAMGVVTGNQYVGGFIARNTGTLDDCYSAGGVVGNSDVGGFCANNTGTITACFWDTQTSGQVSSDGGTGKTTAQMKTESTFTDAGWDFTTIWIIDADINNGYPSFGTFPSVQTLPATRIEATTARINGKVVDDAGDDCEARFRYAEVFQRDDFEWGSDTDPLSDDGGGIDWTISVAGTSVVEIEDAGGVPYAGTRCARLYRDGTNSPRAYFLQTALTSSQVLEFRVRKSETAKLYIVHGNGTYYLLVSLYANEAIYYYDGSTWYDTGATVSVDTWHLISIRNVNWIAATFDIYLDGNLIKTGATMRTTATYSGQVSFQNVAGTSNIYLDNVRVLANRTTTAWDGGSYSTDDPYHKTISGLTAETEYIFATQGRNSGGESLWAAPLFFTTGVSGTRCFTIPDLVDHKGRCPKGARVRAYRVDTHELITEGYLDSNCNATLCGLPNDVDVVFHVTWGGPRTPKRYTREGFS